MRLGADRISSRLSHAGVQADVTVQALGVVCRVRPARVVPALVALGDAGYHLLVDLFAADTRRGIELTYHLRCPEDGREAYVRTRAGYDAMIHSATGTFASAEYAEREAAEMFGISFSGHPDMRRLLTVPEEGPLMRKSSRSGGRGGRK